MIFNRMLLMVSLSVFLLCCPSLAADIDCREQTECEEYDPCRCDLATPIVIEEPATVSEGSRFTASGGRPKYRYTMSPGQINPETGFVTQEPDECAQSVTVTVFDACTPPNEPAMKIVQLDRPALTITGPDEANEGVTYAAEGATGDYRFSFDGGTIGEHSGYVSEISACGTGTVTVEDTCSAVSKSVRLPNGRWVTVEQWSGSYWWPHSWIAKTVDAGSIQYDLELRYGARSTSPFTMTPEQCESSCSVADTYNGWSCKCNVTMAEYLGTSQESTTYYYSMLYVRHAKKKEWQCP